MFTSILVPTDFGAASDAALEYARRVAAKFGATLHVLHVVEGSYATGPMGTEAFITESPAIQQALMDDAMARLNARVTADDRARFNATTELITGVSARVILEFAQTRGIDLIVMGTHGRSGVAHLLMGSVAEKVVRGAPCPVLTVRQAPASVPQSAAVTAAATA
jgi:nucleotide-binding universal stress UspA family protein